MRVTFIDIHTFRYIYVSNQLSIKQMQTVINIECQTCLSSHNFFFL